MTPPSLPYPHSSLRGGLQEGWRGRVCEAGASVRFHPLVHRSSYRFYVLTYCHFLMGLLITELIDNIKVITVAIQVFVFYSVDS